MGELMGREMPPKVLNYLRGGRLVIVATVGPDGRPNSAPFSWVLALDSRTIRMGVNQGVATLHNVKHNGFIALSIVAADLFVTIKGTARVVRDAIEEAPLPTAVVEVQVEEVKDDAVIGRVKPGQEGTRWTDRRRLLSDTTILAALERG